MTVDNNGRAARCGDGSPSSDRKRRVTVPKATLARSDRPGARSPVNEAGPRPPPLSELLEDCARLHRHLCPRQVLGVRMGLLAGRSLDVPVPQEDKRLVVIVETDGCGADGVAVATNCWVGRRTLHVRDFGKMAATFVDRSSERAVRITPAPGCRTAAVDHAPQAESRWQAMLLGYQRMPDRELLRAQRVRLREPIATLMSRPGLRTRCERCGEEIINEREVSVDGVTLCRGCHGEAYYLVEDDGARSPLNSCG